MKTRKKLYRGRTAESFMQTGLVASWTSRTSKSVGRADTSFKSGSLMSCSGGHHFWSYAIVGIIFGVMQWLTSLLESRRCGHHFGVMQWWTPFLESRSGGQHFCVDFYRGVVNRRAVIAYILLRVSQKLTQYLAAVISFIFFVVP